MTPVAFLLLILVIGLLVALIRVAMVLSDTLGELATAKVEAAAQKQLAISLGADQAPMFADLVTSRIKASAR